MSIFELVFDTIDRVSMFRAKNSLSRAEAQHGPNDYRLVAHLDHLAEHYEQRGRYSNAEPLRNRALTICENTPGSDRDRLAQQLTKLVTIYQSQERYAEAESLCERALGILEGTHGQQHESVAMCLIHLAELRCIRGDFAGAEPLCKRAIALFQSHTIADPTAAQHLNYVAWHYLAQNRFETSEPLHHAALAVYENTFSADPYNFARTVYDVAQLYRAKEQFNRAEPLYKRALAIWEALPSGWSRDFRVSDTLNRLGELNQAQGKYEEAEVQFKKVCAAAMEEYGPDSLLVAEQLDYLAKLYRVWGREVDAVSVSDRAAAIRQSAAQAKNPPIEDITITESQVRSKTDTYSLRDISSVHVVEEHSAWKWIRAVAVIVFALIVADVRRDAGVGWFFLLLVGVAFVSAFLWHSAGVVITTAAGRKTIVHYRFLANPFSDIEQRMNLKTKAIADALSDAVSRAQTAYSTSLKAVTT